MSIYLREQGERDEELRGRKYGIDDYFRINDLIAFISIEDMETVLESTDFQQDMQEAYGIQYLPQVYYTPKFESDYSDSSLLLTSGKYRFRLLGFRYDKTGNLIKIVWAVYDVQDSPAASEIAQFYAELDGLDIENTKMTEGQAVYYFTAPNGSAFIEKFDIKTEEPATAYFWEQDGVLCVIIMPGEHKLGNFDFCEFEKQNID